MADVRRAGGEPFGTSAHQTNGASAYVASIDVLLKKLGDFKAETGAEHWHLVKWVTKLESLKGVGSFFAWQIVCDLIEENRVRFDPDWALLGPGAIRGLKLLFPKVKEKKALELLPLLARLKRLQHASFERQRLKFTFFPRDHIAGSDFELSGKELEHALCEYAKYMQTEHPSRRYKAPKVTHEIALHQ
mmetsp:Transcript_12517/g.41280  ORF Transcript_12517/g.41280 Transcript_12517/m.41280 type:complete len:189 (-) Transcript_12517:107-673(-)